MSRSGINFFLFVNTGTTAAPIWTKVAGQRGGTLNRSLDTIDLTTKDSSSWREIEGNFFEWSIEFDALLIETDEGFKHLETAFLAKEKIMVRFNTYLDTIYSGTAILTDFPIEAPFDAEATYSGTLQGSGELTRTVATVPGAPTAVAGTAGNTQVSVAFTAPVSTGGSAITSYIVTSSPGNITATGTASPIIVTGLTNGTAYTFTVRAVNKVGNSNASAASSSVTPTV